MAFFNMNETIELDNKKYSFSKESFQLLLSWFFIAAVAFMGVIMLYQLMLGVLSYTLGYTTVIHFGKVDSSSHLVKYWSDARVLLMYGFTSLLVLLVSFVLLAGFFFGPATINVWIWLKFWAMVFSTLLATTMMSLPIINTMLEKGSLHQGLAVVGFWFGTPMLWKFVLLGLSVIINFVFGLLSSAFLVYLAPPDFMKRKGKKSASRIVLNSFVYVIILLFPVAMFLSYPYYRSFFILLFLHSLLWLPGLLNISTESLIHRSSRLEITIPFSNYILGGTVLSLIVLIRIFFS